MNTTTIDNRNDTTTVGHHENGEYLPPCGIVKLSVAPKFLKAMALFASTDQTREVLCCVALDYTGENPVLVSTDGRRLGVYSLAHPDSFCDVSQAKGKVLLIPTALIAQIKGTRKQIEETKVDFEFEGNTIRMTLERMGKVTSMTQQAAEKCFGRFPKWRQVLPRDPVKAFATVSLNGHFVADFQKAGEILNESSNTPFPTFIAHGSETDKQPVSPYSVRIQGVHEFYGVIMPIHASAQDEERYADCKPDFVK